MEYMYLTFWRMEVDIYILFKDGGVPGMEYMQLEDGGWSKLTGPLCRLILRYKM